jgi:peptide/nickel transport system substrate-binding protein
MAKKHLLKHLKGFARVNAHMPDIINQYQTRQISRRDFMRVSSALGLSAASVYGLAGVSAPAFAQGTPKRGGTLRIDSPLQELKDPQNFSWIEGSNVTRGICEYLTQYSHDGVVKPYLAESWSVSSDGLKFDLNLRKGVKFSNGDEFNADDVIHNFKRWRVDGNTSINNSEWGANVLSDIEKINSHKVRLHLVKPDVSVAHRLYAYPTQMTHRSFDDTGADITKNGIGTGPFKLESYQVGEGAKVVRRDGYWGGPDGKGDAYLDAVHFIDLGEDEQAPISALASGQIDWMYKITPKQLAVVEKLPNLSILDTATAQTPVVRFNVGGIDDKVRQAIVAAADLDEILRVAYSGYGVTAENHHTSRTQPDYFDLPNKPKQDLAKAAQLIEAAGMKGKKIDCTLGNTQGAWEQDVVQVLQQQCAKAGINLNLNVLPQAQYWEVWDKSDFGLTFWTDRPLAVMLHKLAYRSDAKWNEARFKSDAYDKALDAAAASPDAVAASKHMKTCQQLLQDNHVMVQPFFLKLYTGGSNRLKNFPRHPAEFYPFHRVWLEG